MPHHVKVIRESLVLAYVPEPRRIARVKFIPKVGRKDYLLAKLYKPIGLIFFMLKGMENKIKR